MGLESSEDPRTHISSRFGDVLFEGAVGTHCNSKILHAIVGRHYGSMLLSTDNWYFFSSAVLGKMR